MPASLYQWVVVEAAALTPFSTYLSRTWYMGWRLLQFFEPEALKIIRSRNSIKNNLGWCRRLCQRQWRGLRTVIIDCVWCRKLRCGQRRLSAWSSALFVQIVVESLCFKVGKYCGVLSCTKLSLNLSLGYCQATIFESFNVLRPETRVTDLYCKPYNLSGTCLITIFYWMDFSSSRLKRLTGSIDESTWD